MKTIITKGENTLADLPYFVPLQIGNYVEFKGFTYSVDSICFDIEEQTLYIDVN